MYQRVIKDDFNVNTISSLDFENAENDHITNLYWYPNSIILERVLNRCKSKGYSKILEIGPGSVPFPLATTIVGFNERVPDYIDINIEDTPLPFEDKSFDFLYCRHVLEDINNPSFALKEMIRVSKEIYIETPSPMVEMSRYIDAERGNMLFNNLRGYFHHKSFVWSFGNTIYILPKAGAVVEHLYLPDDLLKKLCYLLDNYPVYWNNYFLSDSSEVIDIPVSMNSEYFQNIIDGMEKSINNTNLFVDTFSKTEL